ncbi:regulator of G protein signaling superfamily [Basidiobolus meristosporus CBS 931.73]|uniref:Regulator of G protein signaling superfamily n=1 Tax=Basidiobolus meristosporus CBS 931.73 TaxID=1314790 RepID=A0A1Y1YNS5_9FUNG|nr:regulator of G protein signaling superfamily [Basidiobolus meristosporus CBS 931.73]|eukprot:ORX99652.1 regulator of G protein signaling superfamily [Basidiobolus meristosporus CBS 931.73]
MMPLWLLAVAGRFLRLAFLYHFSQAKLMAGSNNSVNGELAGICTEHGEDRNLVNLNSLQKTFVSQQQPAPLIPTTALDENWYYRHRSKFTTKATFKFIVLGILLQAALTGLAQSFSTKFAILPTVARGNCLVGWEFAPIFLTCGFYVFVICPIFISWLKLVNDAYGIKRELMADFAVGVASFLLYIIFAAIPLFREFNQVFPAAHWCVIALMLSHIFSIVLPIVDAIRGTLNKQSKVSLASFESMLGDSTQFELFKHFSMRDFSVENALFYERCIRLRVNSKQATNEKGVLRADLLLEINSIYHTFISAQSEFQLNLEASTVKAIHRHFQEKTITPDIFDSALCEVRNLMYRHTYPRFVKLREKSLDESGIF